MRAPSKRRENLAAAAAVDAATDWRAFRHHENFVARHLNLQLQRLFMMMPPLLLLPSCSAWAQGFASVHFPTLQPARMPAHAHPEAAGIARSLPTV